MSVYVFTGPSLSPAEAAKELDAVFLPPASEGDVYRVALKRPKIIGIIDGYFERVPSIWHKEILFALSAGVHVFGSASMGALRAAELAAFGMEGIGAIFEAYRDGYLENDDEVAVIHGPAEFGYPNLSEAMVNIRRTLADALAAGIIGLRTKMELEEIGKGIFYRERVYAKVLEEARARGLPDSELSAFETWLPIGRVDQKKEDARAMLRTIRRRLSSLDIPKVVPYHFEHTTLWERAARLACARDVLDAAAPEPSRERREMVVKS